MTVNQISIFLENKYGKLSEILALLAEAHPHHRSHRSRHLRVWNPSYHRKRSPEGIQDIKRKQRQRKPDRRISDRNQLMRRKFCQYIILFHESGHQHRIYVLFLHPGKSDLDLAYEQPGKRP
mgnify:CR=1 FL=1